MKGQAFLSIVLINIGLIIIIGLGNYGMPSFQNGTPPIPPPSFCAESDYLYWINITPTYIRPQEVYNIHLSSEGVVLNNAKGLDVHCYYDKDSNRSMPYQTLVNGSWYQNGGTAFNTSASYQNNQTWVVLFANQTNFKSVICYYANTTFKPDYSESIALWYDDFETYSVGSTPFKATKSIVSQGDVCQTNGEKAVGCNITGGQSMTWNVTEYKNVTALWKWNNSQSLANDLTISMFGQDSKYRVPHISSNNVYAINIAGGGALGTLSYTGSVGNGYDIVQQRNGSQLHLWVAYDRKLNVTDTTYMSESRFSIVPAISSKGLLEMYIWNRTVNVYQNANIFTITKGSC